MSCLFLYPPSDGDALGPDEAEGKKSLLDESAEGESGAVVGVGLELSILLLGVTEPILL